MTLLHTNLRHPGDSSLKAEGVGYFCEAECYRHEDEDEAESYRHEDEDEAEIYRHEDEDEAESYRHKDEDDEAESYRHEDEDGVIGMKTKAQSIGMGLCISIYPKPYFD